MGVTKSSKHEKTDRRRRRTKDTKPEVSWSNVDVNTIAGFIGLAERLDGAIRFGRSRDRTVYSLGFYVGDERFTEWIPGGDEEDMAFAQLYDDLYEDYFGTPGTDSQPME